MKNNKKLTIRESVDENKIREKLESAISEMSNSELYNLWSKFCEEANYIDDMIFTMSMISEFFETTDQLMKHINKSFNFNDRYFKFDGYGYADSFSDISEQIYIDDMIDFIIRDENDLENYEIADILEANDEFEDVEEY